MRDSPGATCVFCGRVIAPDEPTSGRPPMAAHAACADAALADDRHWDAVAGASPEGDVAATPESDSPESKRRSGGCLAVTALALVAFLLPTLLLVAA